MIRIPRMFNTDKKPAGDGDGGSNDTMFKTKPRPRLERRNAIRNIDYELPSVSSSAFSDDCLLSSTSASTPSSSPAQRTRSLDIYPLDKHMSFRIQGNCPGEFEIICRSLGLSGPEDFAIPAAAWENMKVRSSSSSDVFPRLSKFNYGDAITRKIENAVSKDNSSRITSDSVCPPTPSVNDAINRKINNSGSNASRVSDFVCTPSVNDSIDQKLGNADSKDSDFVCTRGINDAINQKIKNAGSKDKASKVSDFVSTPNLNDAFNRKIEIAGSKDNSSRVSDFVCTPSVNDVINRNTEGSGLRVLEVVATPVRSSSVSVRSVRSHNRLRYNHDEVLIENVEGSDVDSNHCENSDYSRIEGIRPPELAPPPAMSLHHVDSVCSTWDILKSFAPDDDHDDDRGSSRSDRSQDEVCIKRDEDEDGEEKDIDHVVESRRANNEESGLLSESCSFATTSNDDDSSSTTMEPFSNISPYGRFRRTISYWEKGELLGRGSFGSVYEGIADGGFFFAVKEVSLLDQGETAKQSIYQLEQEIALLSQFEHDNIVQYYGTDKDESKLYIFLELVTKGSLLSLYQKYHLQDSQVSAYTRQILHGLKYLHDQNVVHRDIKCANILVDASGSVKLADFGLAKATKLNDVKSFKGTVLWMAPEVVNTRNQGYGLAADIWSLGCTVLEMLTGQFPYTHLEPMAALFRIGKGELPRVPESLTRNARDFILQCLQVNPNSRPTASQLLDHPFVQRSLPSSGSTSHCCAETPETKSKAQRNAGVYTDTDNPKIEPNRSNSVRFG